VDVAKLARWDSIEVFNGAQKLGTVASGAAPELKVTIRPEPQVYAIDVLVHDGATRYTAIPFHLIVEDPAIKTQIVAVRSQSQVKPPKKVLGSKTAGAPKGPATTTAPNKEDAALTVYGLTKAQEQQFKAGDGALSAFWKEFTEQHDQVLLTPAKNGGDPKTWKSVFQTLPDTPSLGGNDDISVRVLAARSAAGLYLLFEVTDDQWYQSTDNRLEFDVLDVCFDARSPSDMWTGPWQRSFLNGGWSVSMSTRQIQSWTGEKELLAKVFRYGFPDPWQMGGGVYSVADGAKEFGIAFDAVQVSPTLRAQEWFIPWDELGRKAEPALGERMGFAPGYNDMDPSQHDGLRDSDGNIMHDRLRWPERSGPWGHPSSKGPNPDPWGVLEMGGML